MCTGSKWGKRSRANEKEEEEEEDAEPALLCWIIHRELQRVLFHSRNARAALRGSQPWENSLPRSTEQPLPLFWGNKTGSGSPLCVWDWFLSSALGWIHGCGSSVQSWDRAAPHPSAPISRFISCRAVGTAQTGWKQGEEEGTGHRAGWADPHPAQSSCHALGVPVLGAGGLCALLSSTQALHKEVVSHWYHLITKPGLHFWEEEGFYLNKEVKKSLGIF